MYNIDYSSMMARHFLCNILQHNVPGSIELVKTVSNLKTEQITRFLLTLGGTLDGLFMEMELEFPNFSKYKDWRCSYLKDLDIIEEREHDGDWRNGKE
ncbi:MAG: hypothetical protein IIA82_08315 [Thaumarchaeota archaeon]|nr:hypothetical protein [Nitrososphaerota archaeon]